MTKETFLARLRELDVTAEILVGEDNSYDYDKDTTPPLERAVQEFGELQDIANFFEDRDYDVRIFKFANEEHLIRVVGHYSSYDGTDWCGASLDIVVAKEKTITIYEPE